MGIGIWPRPTLVRKNLSSDLQALATLIQKEAVQKVVVGLPYNMDGTEGAQAKKVRDFVSRLKKHLNTLGVNVLLEWSDERLTSWEAERCLAEKGVKGKRKKEKVDSMAASLILKDYLERKNS